MARGEPDDAKQARELLRESHAMYEEMGMAHYAMLVKGRLRSLERKA
jgi:hypothetical protein